MFSVYNFGSKSTTQQLQLEDKSLVVDSVTSDMEKAAGGACTHFEVGRIEDQEIKIEVWGL